MVYFARRFALLSGFVVLLLLQMSPVLADTIYTAVLSGPTAGTESTATGTATLTLNSAQTEVAYVVEYTGLQGIEIGAHIHNAPPGMDGTRLLLLFPGSPKVGTWAVSAFEVEELNAGRIWRNQGRCRVFLGSQRSGIVGGGQSSLQLIVSGGLAGNCRFDSRNGYR